MSEAQKEVSAIGYSIAANVNGDRQITFQHFIAADAKEEDVNRDIDRIMGFVDRQQAICEIPKLEEEKSQLAGQIAQAEKDLAEIEAGYQTWEDAKNAEIVDLRIKADALIKEGYNEHVGTGRRGTYTPVGARKGQIGNIESDIGKVISEMVAKANEREVALNNLRVNNTHRTNRIVTIDEKIAELKQKV